MRELAFGNPIAASGPDSDGAEQPGSDPALDAVDGDPCTSRDVARREEPFICEYGPSGEYRHERRENRCHL
jgi:hypothetical protein